MELSTGRVRTHRTVLLGDGEVGSLLVLVLHGLEHSLALLLGLLETSSLLIDFALFLLLNLANATLLLFLLALSHTLLLFSSGDLSFRMVRLFCPLSISFSIESNLALGLFVLELLEFILFLGPLFAPFVDVLLQLFVQVRALLVLALDELGIVSPRSSRSSLEEKKQMCKDKRKDTDELWIFEHGAFRVILFF